MYRRAIYIAGFWPEGRKKAISEKGKPMSQDAFGKVAELFQSIPLSVQAANRLGKAYAEGVGHPEYYSPYDESNPESVAMDLAGLYAADTAANILAAICVGGYVTEGPYRSALHAIAAGNLGRLEKYVVKNVANVAWRAGQPFRGINSKPLDRLTRSVNQQFNTLPADQEDKDLVQVQEGARIILEHIGN